MWHVHMRDIYTTESYLQYSDLLPQLPPAPASALASRLRHGGVEVPSIGAAVGGDKAGTAHNVLRGPDPRPASKESKAPPDDDPLARQNRQTGPRESKGILSLLLLSESNI